MSNAILELKDLSARYGALTVLHGISLSVEQGSITALIGANGAGKTTCLRAISGMVKRSGRIYFAGQSIGDRAIEQTALLGIAHVPEGRGTLNGLTVEENLRLGAHRLTSKEFGRELGRVFEYFPKLRERFAQAAGTLSGGEQQMLAISRALISKPRLLMLDEPSFGLAPVVVKSMFSIMSAIQQNERMTILLVEQNVDLVFRVANYCYVLETGRTVLQGEPAELRENAAVRQTYLGI
jgi:branched-chain amino acid transport system ATP-binding protein